MSTTYVVNTYVVKVKPGQRRPFPDTLKERFPNLTFEDIVCDLEDDIVNKATLKYHTDRHHGRHGGDEQAYTMYVAMLEPPNIKNQPFQAFFSGVPAKQNLGSVIVTVFGVTSRQ